MVVLQLCRPLHKLLCKQLAGLAPRPGKNFRRAILLPQNASEPCFIWLPVDVIEADDDDDETFNGTGKRKPAEIENIRDVGVPAVDLELGSAWPNTTEVLGTVDYSLKDLVMGKQGSGELVDHSIWLLQRRDFLFQGLNQCLKTLDLWLASRMGGPIIFCGMTKAQGSTFVVDIDSRDFTLALDGLIRYHQLASQNLVMLRPVTKKTKGIKVSAKEPHFQDVEVPRRHPIFTKGTPSTFEPILKNGLRTYRYSSRQHQPAESSSPLLEPLNPAAYLRLNLNPTSPTFANIPKALLTDPTSVLVVGNGAFNDPPTWTPTAQDLEDHIKNMIRDKLLPRLSDATFNAETRLAAIAMVYKVVRSPGGVNTAGSTSL